MLVAVIYGISISVRGMTDFGLSREGSGVFPFVSFEPPNMVALSPFEFARVQGSRFA